MEPRGSLGVLALSLALPFGTVTPVVAQSVADTFPAALSIYDTGGWQGPGGGTDTGGTITPDPFSGVVMDGTFNALVFAVRRVPPDWLDVTFYLPVTLVRRDHGENDSMSIALLLRDPVLPGGCCATVHGTSAVWVNVNYSKSRVQVYEERNGNAQFPIFETPIIVGDNVPIDIRLTLRSAFLTVSLNGGGNAILNIGAALPGTIALQARSCDIRTSGPSFTNLCPSAIAGDCDGDSISDASDICPRNADVSQLDSDGDGVGDACDPCPGDTINDPDLDGLCGGRDNCPTVANPEQIDFDNDGQGDLCDLDDDFIHVSLAPGDRVFWKPEIGFDSWNVYRGDLSVLPSSGIYTQDPSIYPLAARICSLIDTSLLDSFQPPRGKGVFYLPSGNRASVEGGLGTDSAGQTRPNTFPCPP